MTPQELIADAKKLRDDIANLYGLEFGSAWELAYDLVRRLEREVKNGCPSPVASGREDVLH